MQIIIATGIYPPDVGGPAEYAKHLKDEFVGLGHNVAVVSYSGLEKKLPFGLRHLAYFFRIFFRSFGSDLFVTLDTFSVALPSVLASVILRKKNIIRVSGDFLWESYAERAGELVPLRLFYKVKRVLSFKEKIIFRMMKFALSRASLLVFNSEWQKDILVPAYNLDYSKVRTILNFFGDSLPASDPLGKNFIWATRPIKLKNGEMLRAAFAKARVSDSSLSLDERVTSHEELFRRLASCYAVILPSLSEVSPNFIIDAIRFGKPFIMTRESGLADILGDVGLRVDPLDESDITEKILMLADPSCYAKQKKLVEAFNFRHSWAEIANEFLELANRS
ncbi:MAG: Glycosyltransferase [Parcubacteria group bacterium GW2011_GWA2_47_16]|nr:MAG: Glycosyltransferase [Parcubacteria group bacterium GW2011_GWA2_47_16]